MLCHSNVLLLSRSNKNIITIQKKKIKISFLWDKNQLTLFSVITIFLYSVYILHIGNLLILFVIVLETKKIDLLILI